MASLHDELEKNLQDSNARPNLLPLDFLKAITHNFSTESELGRGGYGVVYKGVLRSGKIIAVKNLFAIHLLDDKTFRNEVGYLMDIKHPNVVQFIGYCAESTWETRMKSDGTFIWAEIPKRLLCFEHLCNGSLCKYIYDESSDLKWKMRYGIIKGICSGLNFLHEECRLVHLDLKPENILMDATMIPKIADFGLSRMFGKQSRIVTDNRVGSRGYMAPEYLDQGLISKKADIFSFGVIIIEIITGGRDYPYFQLDSPQSMVTSRQHYTEKVLGNWRNKFASTQKHKSLEKYTHQVKQCVTVALKCVDPSMERRPTAKEIIQVFNAVDQMEAQKELSPVTQCIDKLVLLNTNTSKDPTPLIKTSTTSKVVDEATSEGLSPMLTLESSTITQNYQGEAKARNEILSLRDPNTKAATGPRAHQVSLQHLKDITDNFSQDRILGSGGFGVVYKGLLQNGEVVAVKKLVQLTPKSQKQFENEVDLLMTLKHANVVLLLNYCYDTQPLLFPERLLCLEYMPNGSLYDYITDADAPSALDWQTRCKIIEGISFGLWYLHEGSNVPIIHLDLKPANILLDENFVPKITDFGLSRLFDPKQTINTAAATGTLGYMSLEYQLRGTITPMADIFSLGVIIMEIITGHRDYPYDIRKFSKEFIKQEMQKWRNKLQNEPGYTTLEIDCQQIERYIQIGLICVNPERSKRPTMKKIIDMLKGVESMNWYIRNELSIDDIQEEL